MERDGVAVVASVGDDEGARVGAAALHLLPRRAVLVGAAPVVAPWVWRPLDRLLPVLAPRPQVRRGTAHRNPRHGLAHLALLAPVYTRSTSVISKAFPEDSASILCDATCDYNNGRCIYTYFLLDRIGPPPPARSDVRGLPGAPSAGDISEGGATFVGDDGCGVAGFGETKKACRQRSSIAGSARIGCDAVAASASISWSSCGCGWGSPDEDSNADGVFSQENVSFEADCRATRPLPVQAKRTTACRSQLLLPLPQNHPRSPSISREVSVTRLVQEEREEALTC